MPIRQVPNSEYSYYLIIHDEEGQVCRSGAWRNRRAMRERGHPSTVCSQQRHYLRFPLAKRFNEVRCTVRQLKFNPVAV